MSFVYFNAIMPAQTNGALVIMQLKMSNQAFFSTSLSIAGIAGALVTSLYGKIYKIFRHYTPVFIMALGVVGYLGMVHSKNMLMYTLFMIIATSTSLIFPYIYGAVMEDVPASAKDFTLSIAKVFNNFGAFLSPYTMAFTAQLLGKHDAVSIFNIAAGYMVFIGIVFIVLALLRNANNHKEIKKVSVH
ncbi:hypothetical protein [Ligilactobacillus agilis]|uniref:hypothetical protein n=1 Tax=Ligilactobacillus agilis TaxID=1601 RepID=UPI003F8C6F92|nr:hypothetical protein [Ligilactobacillus agilis]